jgi:hypothetical protein
MALFPELLSLLVRGIVHPRELPYFFLRVRSLNLMQIVRLSFLIGLS